MKKADICALCIVSFLAVSPWVSFGQDAPRGTSQSMDKLWGDRIVKLRAENAKRGQLFDEGNYAMFITGACTLNLRTRSMARPTMASANG